MKCEYASLTFAAASGAGALLGAGVAYWAARRQTPKSDTRIDGIALKYQYIGEGKNLFIATVTNHGNEVAEIKRTEVHAMVNDVPAIAVIGAMNVVGTLAAGASKELWLEVTLPDSMGMKVHEGNNRLRVQVTLHMKNCQKIQSSFDFSRDPGYGFEPSATP